MKNIKIFIVVFAVVILASTFFRSAAMAAKITGINQSKGRIHIDGGINNGFIPGGTVCFFVSSATYGNELVCGTVVSADASTATVKVAKTRAKIMKIGTEAMLPVKKEEVKAKDNDTKAHVSKVNINEGLIDIDRGADSGFTSGATVCFAVSPEKEQVCGKVKAADAAKAVVAVETGAKEITVGTEAFLGTEEKPGAPAKAKADWFR